MERERGKKSNERERESRERERPRETERLENVLHLSIQADTVYAMALRSLQAAFFHLRPEERKYPQAVRDG